MTNLQKLVDKKQEEIVKNLGVRETHFDKDLKGKVFGLYNVKRDRVNLIKVDVFNPVTGDVFYTFKQNKQLVSGHLNINGLREGQLLTVDEIKEKLKKNLTINGLSKFNEDENVFNINGFKVSKRNSYVQALKGTLTFHKDHVVYNFEKVRPSSDFNKTIKYRQTLKTSFIQLNDYVSTEFKEDVTEYINRHDEEDVQTDSHYIDYVTYVSDDEHVDKAIDRIITDLASSVE